MSVDVKSDAAPVQRSPLAGGASDIAGADITPDGTLAAMAQFPLGGVAPTGMTARPAASPRAPDVVPKRLRIVATI